jgi:hypothetical protein
VGRLVDNGLRRLIGRARTGTTREHIGLIAAVVTFVAIATTFAFQTPPFFLTDETAHLGYAHEIADFDLPEIDVAPDIPASATQWQAEADAGADDRYRAVWVANHPPLFYVAVAPLMWISDVLDQPDGGLMFLRVANIAFAAVGIVFTYLFALEVTGGARRIALAAASLVALLPQAYALFSTAFNDGLGFAAGAALLWAATRCLRRGPSTPNLVLLGAAAIAAWGARASTMLLSIVVIGLVAVVGLVRQGSWRQRLSRASLTVGIGLMPALVIVGWYYARNVHLYGDIGASEFLLDRFNRDPEGGVLSIVTSGHLWVDLYHMLLSPSPLFFVKAPPGTNPATFIAAVGLFIAIVLGRTGDRAKRQPGWPISRLALALGAVSIAVIALTIAQHVSGGGNSYARYLFPVLAVLVSFIAIGLDRLIPRVLPAAAVGALGFWAWRNVPTTVDLESMSRQRDRGRGMPDVLRVVPSSAWSRDLLLGMAVAGSVVLGAVIVVGLFRLPDEYLRQRVASIRGRTSYGEARSFEPGTEHS